MTDTVATDSMLEDLQFGKTRAVSRRLISNDRHRSLRPERDRAFDVVVIITSSILMIIALTMEILDRKDRSNADQVAPTSLP